MNIQRKGIDHDPIQPWYWGTTPFGHIVEILSYPVPHQDARGEIDSRATIMVRTTPGDPTTLREIPLKFVAVFHPDRMGGSPCDYSVLKESAA